MGFVTKASNKPNYVTSFVVEGVGFDDTQTGCTSCSGGDSAYDIAVKNGFKGTEKEWLQSLQGKNGSVWKPVLSKDGTLSWVESDDHTAPEDVELLLSSNILELLKDRLMLEVNKTQSGINLTMDDTVLSEVEIPSRRLNVTYVKESNQMNVALSRYNAETEEMILRPAYYEDANSELIVSDYYDQTDYELIVSKLH